MHWFFIALGAPFLWAVVNIADKYLVSKFSDKEKEKSSGALVLFSSLIGIFIALLILVFTPGVLSISLQDAVLLLFAGVLTVVWIILYLFTLETEETSLVVPWFLSVPVFGYILGYFFLGENLTVQQFIGSGVIFSGLIMISWNWNEGERKLKHKPVLYMLCASVAIAISGIIFKYVTVGGDFWVSSFWEYVGLGASGLLIYTFIPHYRTSFHLMNRSGGATIFSINVLSEFMSIAGNLLTNWALLLAPVALVYTVGSFQPAIVLALTIIATRFIPSIANEDISRKVLLPKIIAILVMIVGSSILFL